MKVELGASAVFQGTAEFTDISVLPREDTTRIYRKGAALHNKVASYPLTNTSWSISGTQSTISRTK